MAAQRLADDVWHERARRTAARVAASLERHGPRCGLPLGVESPGLMTGLAGIGYGLLRLAAPEAVPSVLCLEPPDIPVPPLSPEVS